MDLRILQRILGLPFVAWQGTNLAVLLGYGVGLFSSQKRKSVRVWFGSVLEKPSLFLPLLVLL